MADIQIPEPGKSVVVPTKDLGLEHLIPAVHDPRTDEGDAPESVTEIHRPRVWESYEHRTKCPHLEFVIDSINLQSKLVDEKCGGCGLGRIRGMTADELAEALQSRPEPLG